MNLGTLTILPYGWSLPPSFELEVYTPQLLKLGPQTEGFLLARLELHFEAAGFLLAPLE